MKYPRSPFLRLALALAAAMAAWPLLPFELRAADEPAAARSIEGLWQGYEADADERRLLGEAADLLERQSGAKARLKAAEASLNSRVAAGYRGMDADAVRDLVIDHKWLVAVESQIKALGNAAVRALAARVNQLAGRYAQPLPDVEAEIAGLDQLVRRHLEELGAWRS